MNLVQHISRKIDADTGMLYSWFGAMHTRIDLVMYDSPDRDLKYVAEFIYTKVKELEKIANYFDSQSELSFVNCMAAKTPVIISRELYTIINQALYYNKLTFGYFDVTVHSENHDTELCSKIILEDDKSTVHFRHEGIKINLSGFIKGYTLDIIRNLLKEAGISNALVNMGNSSVMAVGNHPKGNGWKIKSENQSEDVILIDKCFTTSGNNSPERMHIINPYSNEYMKGVRYFSAITNTASEGEALSTSLFVANDATRKEILKNFEATVFDY